MAVSGTVLARGAHYLLLPRRRLRALSRSSCCEDGNPHVHALRCSRALVTPRSLSPDDPFGERSSWEDPSDGIYAAWKDVDQEGFVNAAASQEVRQAHFGPEWARFSTVSRMSVKKMREDQRLQHAPSSGAAEDGSKGAAVEAAACTSATQRYPTAEELHEAELRQRRRLLERSYSSYEAFVEHELGSGEGLLEAEESLSSASEAEIQRDAKAEMHSAVSTERTFLVMEGFHGRHRVAQRNVEREAVETLKASEVAERVPLPSFMLVPDSRSAAAAPTMPSSSPTPTPTTSGSIESEFSMSKTAARTSSEAFSASAFGIRGGVPAHVVRQVLGALSSPHGDSRLPLTDPMHWETEDIILFLKLMERPPLSPMTCHSPVSSAWSTMDATMCDTFRMARVTGETLLNVVVPPRLFRLMRQWHIRREDVVRNAWKLRAQMEGAPATATDSRLPNDVVQMAVAQNCERLAEAVQQLDRALIQETILLSFPYGR
ncbi:hypothetical protein CUR178_02004 [Leishmania enriettii]|uniref:Uncharacterized protein n=1 Tax=Leishmania enriettii TaxID=5663 RepID=A0A836GTY8_LEIEN|nr:hypothetical protein CUR178_02004 [Leishmania enriettii]